MSFYEKGLKDGLPYRADGTPTNVEGEQATYAKFVAEFRAVHKLDTHPDAREVCVLCGGELGKPEVDHWVSKAGIPLLSVCADNLLPICGDCNFGDDTKGQKPVHDFGVFTDWFHPYLRPANGALHLTYLAAPEFEVKCKSIQLADQAKADNLNKLLNLSHRWTLKFKAEHRKKTKELYDLKRRGRSPDSFAALQAWLTDYRDSLLACEPDYEVHNALSNALLEPARVDALLDDLLAP